MASLARKKLGDQQLQYAKTLINCLVMIKNQRRATLYLHLKTSKGAETQISS
jgi:hypothetical protein